MFLTYSPKVSPQRRREPTLQDSGSICAALKANIISVREATVSRIGNPEVATKRIVEHQVQSVIVDEAYLIVYDVCEPWYSEEVILVELMILRIGEGSSFDAVVDMMDDLAEEYNTTCTHVGSAFARSPRALSRLYSRRGFIPENRPSLIKWR